MKLSVIVPVYNVEPYLRDCLDSIFAQDFREKMEVICVNDASTDQSMRILEEYREKHPNFIVLSHEHNRGLSAARNTGLDAATGQYVWFVDSDDMIVPGACDILYAAAAKYQTDIVFFNMSFLNEVTGYSSRKEVVYRTYDGVMSGRELFCRHQEDGTIKVEVWRQFFLRRFLLEHHIRFCEGLLHEDHLFSFQCAMEAERVMDINGSFYLYRQRNGSISYSNQKKRAHSFFVTLSKMYIYWNTHTFTERESLLIGQRIRGLVQAFLRFGSFTDGVLSVGTYAEKLLYSALAEENQYLLSKEQIVKLAEAEHILVYGAGGIAEKVIRQLQTCGFVVEVAAVSSLEGNVSYVRGVPVMQWEDAILSYERRDIYVIIGVSAKFQDEIRCLLEKEGIQHVVELQ